MARRTELFSFYVPSYVNPTVIIQASDRRDELQRHKQKDGREGWPETEWLHELSSFFVFLF